MSWFYIAFCSFAIIVSAASPYVLSPSLVACLCWFNSALKYMFVGDGGVNTKIDAVCHAAYEARQCPPSAQQCPQIKKKEIFPCQATDFWLSPWVVMVTWLANILKHDFLSFHKLTFLHRAENLWQTITDQKPNMFFFLFFNSLRVWWRFNMPQDSQFTVCDDGQQP